MEPLAWEWDASSLPWTTQQSLLQQAPPGQGAEGQGQAALSAWSPHRGPSADSWVPAWPLAGTDTSSPAWTPLAVPQPQSSPGAPQPGWGHHASPTTTPGGFPACRFLGPARVFQASPATAPASYRFAGPDSVPQASPETAALPPPSPAAGALRSLPWLEDLLTSCAARSSSRRRRTVYTPEQLRVLEEAFLHHPRPGLRERETLARLTGVPEHRLQVWFQNKRARHRKPK